jgi:hypothetical protein
VRRPVRGEPEATAAAFATAVLRDLDAIGVLPGEYFAVVRPDLNGPGQARGGDPDTAKEAALGLDREGLRGRVLLAIQDAGKATSWEVAATLGVERDSVSPRMGELRKKLGLVAFTGETRTSPSGCSQKVFELTPAGEEKCDELREEEVP